ncbi:MAG: hypothetical protein LBG05_10495 [Treponema sp.]|jgi:hypothetical protein|nr:hypothetical protein [Treponema sp.]
MIGEDKKLRHIGGRPLTKITPEMEELIDRFARDGLTAVDKLIVDLEIASDTDEEEQQ